MSHGWRVSSLIFFFLLSACGNGKPQWNSFPIPLQADAGFVSSNAREADLRDALQFWEERAGRKLFDYQGTWNDGLPYSGSASDPQNIRANVIFFQNPWPFGSGIAGRTTTYRIQNSIQSGVIMVNPQTPFCERDCLASPTGASERNMLAHELGHLLGLEHVDDPQNIMYPTVLSVRSLGEARVDEKALADATRN